MEAKYLVEVHTVDPEKPNDTYLYSEAELRSWFDTLDMDDGDYIHITREDRRTTI